MEGEEGNDVSEGSSLQQNYQDDEDDGDDCGVEDDDYEYGDEDDDYEDDDGDGEIRRSPTGWLDQGS